MPIPAAQLPPNVVEALRRGNVLEAIKLLRQATGVGLKEATHAIGGHLRGHTAPTSHAASPRGPMALNARHPPARRSGLSPGEMPRSGGGLWWLGALAVGTLVSGYLLWVPS